MHLQNEFAVDVMNHAWEWKFVYCSVDTIYTLLLETKGIPLLYWRVWCDPFKWMQQKRNWARYNSDTSWTEFHFWLALHFLCPAQLLAKLVHPNERNQLQPKTPFNCVDHPANTFFLWLHCLLSFSRDLFINWICFNVSFSRDTWHGNFSVFQCPGRLLILEIYIYIYISTPLWPINYY